MEKIFLYKITNNKNGHVYFGQTKREDGKSKHYRLCEFRKCNSKSSRPISRAIKKYGWNCFTHEIVGFCLSRHAANIAEKALIKFGRTTSVLYNLTDGGEGMSGWNPSKTIRKKLSNSMGHLWGNKKFRSDRCKRISSGRIGMKLSALHRNNISVAMTGVKYPLSRRKNIARGASIAMKAFWKKKKAQVI